MAIAIGTSYGYYVTDSAETKLLFACRFSVPLVFFAPVDHHDIKAVLNAMPTTSPGFGPVMDDGLLQDLDGWVYANPGMKMHLYVNNYTPLPSSVLGDFTEAAWPGYAAQTLSVWSAASIVGTNLAEKQSVAVTFNAS